MKMTDDLVLMMRTSLIKEHSFLPTSLCSLKIQD